jgi:hypothetical protein
MLICCLAGFLGIWGVASAQTLPAAFRLHGPALQQRLQAVWTESWQRPGILTGSAQAKRRIVVFFDPNCPYCAHLWGVSFGTPEQAECVHGSGGCQSG